MRRMQVEGDLRGSDTKSESREMERSERVMNKPHKTFLDIADDALGYDI
jgi:hypothetical protein